MITLKVLDRKTKITATGGSSGSGFGGSVRDGSGSSSTITHYEGDVEFATDYYPFGSPRSWSTPDSSSGRMYSGAGYRYGFNGQERDDELGAGVTTAEFWMYDGKLGRRWNLDPVTKPWESLYACLSDNPILLKDPDGDDPGNPKRYIVIGGDNLAKIGNKYGVSVDNLVKWNNIPNRDQIKIGQSLIVSDPTKVKESEGFVWFNSANSTFSELKTVKKPEEYLWWASGNSPRTNSPVSNQPFKPLSTTASNKTQNAQISGGGYINLSDPIQYPGISIYQNNDKSDKTAITLPGFGIYIGGGYSGNSLNRVMQHEYGHYLDYRFSLDLNYNGQGFINF